MEFLQYSTNVVVNNNDQNFLTNNNGNKRRKSCNNYTNNSTEDFNVPVRQRSQANARERDRTHSVNTAFSTLRTLIPTEPKDRKLSKIETLRLASSYISHLGTQLMAGPIDQPCLRVSKSLLDDDSNNSSSRHQVCTFCIAHKKSPKRNIPEDYECPSTYENQIFLNSSSTSITSTILSNNDLTTTIYYHQ